MVEQHIHTFELALAPGPPCTHVARKVRPVTASTINTTTRFSSVPPCRKALTPKQSPFGSRR
jgi:hypothetical protein